MGCKKFGFPFAAMAVVLLATLIPITLATRNEIGPLPDSTKAVTNIRNPLANILMVGKKEAGDCIPYGGFCWPDPTNCCGNCGCLIIPAKTCSCTCL
ncbi:hypothetical protein DITRI_Ditri12bG0100200 [Diplodiscus trichospermus]